MKKTLFYLTCAMLLVLTSCSRYLPYARVKPSNHKESKTVKAETKSSQVSSSAETSNEALISKPVVVEEIVQGKETVASVKVTTGHKATAPETSIKAITTGKAETKISTVPVVKQTTTKANKQKGSEGRGGKSQLVALLLCIFVGALGIHRFYLGYTVIGIIQLLTLGGCGIWALIDLIRIITGDLKPKDGEYEEEL